MDRLSGDGRDKRTLRRALIERRTGLSEARLRAAARAVRAHVLAAPDVRRAAVIAAYAPVGAEPGDLELLDELRAAGKTVLLPVVAPGRTLLWRVYTGQLIDGPWGLRQPPAGDPSSLARAELALAPALAADRFGHRLGRGGGYYDRALGAGRPDLRIAVLLHDGELLDRVPHEPHDHPVHVAVSPGDGWTPLGGERPVPSTGPEGRA